MEALKLIIEGSFNSFRLPSAMKYQQTFPLPPKTTLVGLLGAALGLDDEELVRKEAYQKVSVSVISRGAQGRARDLWGITKLKTGGDPEHAVVMRELIYRPMFVVYFCVEPGFEYSLTDIESAFKDPAYPLTLGRSDELVIIRLAPRVELEEATPDDIYKHTLLPFNYREKDFKPESINVTKPNSFRLPEVSKLPTSFEINKNGVRVPEGLQDFTFVHNLGLKFCDVKGCKDGEFAFFIF